MTSWIDGVLSADTIRLADRGFLLGDGVFDTLVAFGRRPFAGERHLARLSAHAAAIGIAVDGGRVRDGWAAVLAAMPDGHAVLRTTVTRGVARRGLWPAADAVPTLAVAASPWSAELAGRPLRLAVAAIRRNEGAPTSRLKTLGYLDNVLAARDAAAAGADDALLVNGAGRVACTTIANVLAVRGDRLSTPPLSDGVLDGVTRQLLLEAAPRLGLIPEERSMTVAEFAAADAAMAVNSVRFVQPVAALDGRAVGDPGHPAIAALGRALAAAVRAECGCDAAILPA